MRKKNNHSNKKDLKMKRKLLISVFFTVACSAANDPSNAQNFSSSDTSITCDEFCTNLLRCSPPDPKVPTKDDCMHDCNAYPGTVACQAELFAWIDCTKPLACIQDQQEECPTQYKALINCEQSIAQD